jgi:hypothetical protein
MIEIMIAFFAGCIVGGFIGAAFGAFLYAKALMLA